jgi:hypothetical protein
VCLLNMENSARPGFIVSSARVERTHGNNFFLSIQIL